MKLKRILLLSLLIPINAFAYTLVPSGSNIGINLNMKGILVVGTYKKVDNILRGDLITKVEGNTIESSNDMSKYIKENMEYINITYLRNNKENNTRLKLYKEDNIIKTGLYVKDSISGIGTLTYIDPSSKTFGALGHEIPNEISGKPLEIKDGEIYKSSINSIIPSNDGSPGEIEATYDKNKVKGEIYKNTKEGIFGNYLDNIDKTKALETAKPSLGKAYILTNIDQNNPKKYEINILEISNSKKDTKNFIFEITDQELLKKTNGIIQGMSGSPILQNDKLVGAVTHVIVDYPHKGYGIFINNMVKNNIK